MYAGSKSDSSGSKPKWASWVQEIEANPADFVDTGLTEIEDLQYKLAVWGYCKALPGITPLQADDLTVWEKSIIKVGSAHDRHRSKKR